MSRHKSFLGPEWWLQISDELLMSAEVLIDNIKNSTCSNAEGNRSTHSRALGLVLALSIENLVKGNLILFNPGLISSEKISDNITSGHPLLKQLKKINDQLDIAITDQTQELIKKLENFLTTSSRYPAGKYNSSIYQVPSIDSNFLDQYWYLHFKLKKVLISKLETEGWLSGQHDRNIDTHAGDFRYFVKINGRVMYFSSLDGEQVKIVYAMFQP
jgi:hypothetical protein